MKSVIVMICRILVGILSAGFTLFGFLCFLCAGGNYDPTTLIMCLVSLVIGVGGLILTINVKIR